MLPAGFVDDGTQPLERAITVSQGPDGTEGAATATYLPSAPGEYRVHVLLRGEPLRGSPFACTVAPAGIFPTATREAYASAARRPNAMCTRRTVRGLHGSSVRSPDLVGSSVRRRTFRASDFRFLALDSDVILQTSVCGFHNADAGQ